MLEAPSFAQHPVGGGVGNNLNRGTFFYTHRLFCEEKILTRSNLMKTKSLILFVVVILALLMSACGATVSPQAVRTLNVSGSGEANLAPDIAYIYVGVHTENKTAAEG